MAKNADCCPHWQIFGALPSTGHQKTLLNHPWAIIPCFVIRATRNNRNWIHLFQVLGTFGFLFFIQSSFRPCIYSVHLFTLTPQPVRLSPYFSISLPLMKTFSVFHSVPDATWHVPPVHSSWWISLDSLPICPAVTNRYSQCRLSPLPQVNVLQL